MRTQGLRASQDHSPIGSSSRAAVFLLCLCAAIPFATTAHEGAQGIVKERMMAMEGIGTAMKEIKAMLRGEKAYDARSLAAQARRIRDHSGTALTRLFPEGSLHGPSEASPSIWQRWELFETLAQDLGASAERLALAAERAGSPARPESASGKGSKQLAMAPENGTGSPGTALPMAAFATLAKSCAACHREFRIKK